MLLNEKIAILENKILELESKLDDLSRNTEETYHKPLSIVGGSRDQSLQRPIDIRSGRGNMLGSPILWNNTEIDAVFNTQPSIPTIGYNKHSHSRFSGGALIKDALEIVDYEWGAITNKHSQGFLSIQPEIKKEINSHNESVDKIGLLDLIFNPDTRTWGVAAYEIDIKKCNFVERDESGNIIHSAPLWNEDQTKTSIIWDESAQCWRFFAVYAPGTPDGS